MTRQGPAPGGQGQPRARKGQRGLALAGHHHQFRRQPLPDNRGDRITIGRLAYRGGAHGHNGRPPGTGDALCVGREARIKALKRLG